MRFLILAFLFMNAALYGQRSDFSNINFKKADSIAELYKGASLKNLPILVHNLTTHLPTQVEKFRAIYTWVCTNIENDYASYQKTVKKRKKLKSKPEALTEWNNSFTPKVFKKLVNQKKTACTGYAFLTREMASLAEIKCKIVNGYGRTATLTLDKNSIPNHSWNKVKLNGKWYLCDPTWSAGKIVLEEEGPRFEPNYFDGYFLARPGFFIKNHYPLEIDSALLTTPPSYKEFTQGPVVYKEAYKLGIMPKAPFTMNLETTKNKALHFVLSAASNLDGKLSLDIFNGISTTNIVPKTIKTNDNYSLQHSFKKAGLYDVHIKLDNTLLATYVVKVKRK